MLFVPMPPTPMQPRVILLLAPKADAGMMLGKPSAAMAAVEVLRKSRRFIGVFMTGFLGGDCLTVR